MKSFKNRARTAPELGSGFQRSIAEKVRSRGLGLKFKPGYGPGGAGLLLEELLHAYEQMSALKGVSMHLKHDEKRSRKSWLGYFHWKAKCARLKEEFLRKVRLKDEPQSNG